jgi:hypothetical protein
MTLASGVGAHRWTARVDADATRDTTIAHRNSPTVTTLWSLGSTSALQVSLLPACSGHVVGRWGLRGCVDRGGGGFRLPRDRQGVGRLARPISATD